MDIPPVLKKLGLTDLEIKLYTTLLKQKESTASNLVKLTGIQRRGVYDAVERLIRKGLVSFVEQKYKRIYRPVNPKALLTIVEERQAQMSELEKEVSSILPKLEKSFAASYEKPEVNVFVGKEGVKTVVNEVFTSGKDISFVSSKGAVAIAEELLGINFAILREKYRKLAKIRFIEDDTPEMRELAKEDIKASPFIKTRFLPATQSPPISFIIYGNNVVFMRWGNEPLVVSIKDSDFAKGFMDYFDTLWKIAKK